MRTKTPEKPRVKRVNFKQINWLQGCKVAKKEDHKCFPGIQTNAIEKHMRAVASGMCTFAKPLV